MDDINNCNTLILVRKKVHTIKYLASYSDILQGFSFLIITVHHSDIKIN